MQQCCKRLKINKIASELIQDKFNYDRRQTRQANRKA